MPEIVDLEVSKNNLVSRIRGKKIISVETVYPSIVKNCPQSVFQKEVLNKEVVEIQRYGKTLVIVLKDCKIVIHLMLLGDLKWCGVDQKIKNTVLRVCFEGDNCVCVTDYKKWVRVELDCPDSNVKSSVLNKKLGVDPLSGKFTVDLLKRILEKRGRRGIKALLMDQNEIAGIGNAYSDEILWDAKIHPFTKSSKVLENGRLTDLYSSTIKVIKNSIAQVEKIANGDISEQDRSFMKVYRKEKENCPRCSNSISKIKAYGRDTYICEKCQSLSN